MHVFWFVALIFGVQAILVLGLVGVVHDLLQCGPYEPPLIRHDGLAWPTRYRGSPNSNLQPARSETRFARAAWSERGSGRL